MHFFTVNSISGLFCVLFVLFAQIACLQPDLTPEPKSTEAARSTIQPTATAQTFDFGVSQSQICETLPAEPIRYDNGCVSNMDASPIPNDACVPMLLAQAACGDESGAQSLCLEGYEVNCRRTSFAAQSEIKAPQSICSGLTVNGIGYAATASTPYTINEGCLQAAPVNRQVVNCEFMGQLLAVNIEFCQRLTSCVAPQLTEAFDLVESVGNEPVYRFPSGVQRLHVDLTCSEQALPTSLHHPQNGCRAIDINVNQNYGNLREVSRIAPVSTIPPAFVAIMEGCGIVWGGRYNGAEGIAQGCDPMEFAYAPSCFE